MSDSISTDIICKSNNDFSFLSTVFDLTNNKEFCSQMTNVLCSNLDTQYTNIWNTLSAIGEQIGGVFQSNINNFIDNISNVDLCKVRQLQSLISFTGIKYNIIDTINTFPTEIQDLIDILSIKREYLLNSKKINKKFTTILSNNNCINQQLCSSNSISVINDINKYRFNLINNAQSVDLSSNWNSIYLSVSQYLDDNKYYEYLTEIYTSFLSNKVNATYNDDNKTKIYYVLSNSILLSGFQLENTAAQSINKYKLQNCIPADFNVEEEADKIEKLQTELTDYSEYEKNVINEEISRRKIAFNALQPYTRYKYYKELEVKEYFEFIENEYVNYISSFASLEKYDIDNQYFILSGYSDSTKSLLSVNEDNIPYIKYNWIDVVVRILVKLTFAIREIREQLKTQCQKNFMKGTFLLISYLINEYLRNNIIDTVNNINELYNKNAQKVVFNQDKNTNDIIEYEDPINYFNLSTQHDNGISGLNERYWEVASTIKAIAAIDNTNVFSTPPSMDSLNFAFKVQELEQFYKEILKNKFSTYSVSNKKSYQFNQHLNDFLNLIFDLGADDTRKNENGELIYTTNQQLSAYKQYLYDSYSGNLSSNLPYYYLGNQYHPSYQIHPYMSSFIEKIDYSYPIENVANVVNDNITEILKTQIDELINDDGYLINAWKNPLATNSDYMSRYENSDHRDDNNEDNEVIAYDGLFYPSAIAELTSTSCGATKMCNMIKSHTKYSLGDKNYYYGLNLTEQEKNKICKQITEFNTALIYEATQYHCIYRYALDNYKNAYILVKNCPYDASEETKKKSSGTLWIRLKNHPLAFPAYAFNVNGKDGINNNNLAQIYVNAETSNTAVQYADAISIHETKYNTYNIQDFFISNNKSYMILNIQRDEKIYPLILNISKQYDESNKINLYEFKKIDASIDSMLNIRTEELSDYAFDTFFENDDNEFGVFLHKKPEKIYGSSNCSVDIQARYCNLELLQTKSSNEDSSIQIKHKKLAGNCHTLTFPIEENTDICLDANNDNTIDIAYVASYGLSNSINYTDISVKYDELDDYLRSAARQFIVTEKFTTGETILQKEVEKNNTFKNCQLYASYTDQGFFGILSSYNNLSNTILTYDTTDSTTKNTELKERGILKFQLLGKQKEKIIDFKFLLPIRMFERYSDSISADLSLVSYFYAHFGEDISEYANKISSDNPIYEPLTLVNILDGKSPILRVQDEYFKYIKKTNVAEKSYRLYNEFSMPPYLWFVDKKDMPDIYINPGKYKNNADPDNFIINIYPNTIPLSTSWHRNDDGTIALNFNTEFYNNAGADNYFNEKRVFLNLDKPGESGYLNTFKNDLSCEILKSDVTYYIKNISDNYPKFILSAYNWNDYNVSGQYVITEQYGKQLVTEDSMSSYIITE